MGVKIKIACQGHTTLPLESLEPFQGELKDLSKENYDRLRKQILELGFSEPVSVWQKDGKNYLLNGHQRVRVLTEMKRSEKAEIPAIPVNLVEAANEHEAKKKILSLTSQFGEITSQGLFEFASLNNIDLPTLEDFRFPEIDMDKWKAEFFDEPEEEGLTDADEVPEVPQNIHGVKRGQIWKLGDHRLMCGDSTSESDVSELMNGEKADMVFTDPPYGDNHAASEMVAEDNRVKGKSIVAKVQKIKNDDNIEFLSEVSKTVYHHLKNDFSAFVFFKWNKWEKIKEYFSVFGEPKTVCVWDRDSQGASTFRINPVHEFCFYWGTLGDKKETGNLRNVWRCRKELENKTLHPTVKPIEIIETPIRMCCEKDGLVIDLFGGSGSTLIACEKTGRKCFMMELDEHYCSVIIERWQKFTGKTAELIKEVP